MRCLRFFILIALLHDIFGLHQLLPAARPDNRAAFTCLDVCSAFSAQAEADDEASLVSDAQGDAMPRPAVLTGCVAGSPLTEFLLVYQEERPPKA